MTQITFSGFSKKTSRLVAKQHREEYRKHHGVNPPSTKETISSLKTHIENMTPKDHAALQVQMAQGDVDHSKMFSRTPMERLEAENNLKYAQRRYLEASGEETPRMVSLREKVCDFLKDNIRIKWRVREIAEAVGHPPEHVGVVVSFLRKEGEYTNIIK